VPNKEKKCSKQRRLYETLDEDMQVAKYNGAWYDRSGFGTPRDREDAMVDIG
jgi:hypothetical protein